MVIQGIIRPPPDIRVVADRTAQFVAKNGRAFEQRILGSAKGKTPKFAFLQPTSPFHAYYEDRIRHFESGGDKEEKKDEGEAKESEKDKASEVSSKAPTPAKDKVTKQKASIMDPVAKAIIEQRKFISNHLKKEKEKRREAAKASEQAESKEGDNAGPAEPTGDNETTMLPLPAPPMPLETVHVVAPYYLTPTQIETIQLVAQFVAMDGKGGPFLPALVNREWANPEFGFCQPRNIHFSYFSALVDAYRNILGEYVRAAEAKESAPHTGQDKAAEATKEKRPTATPVPEEKTSYGEQDALKDAAYRTEYERELERRRQKHQENSGAGVEDGEIANAIDWHDFVVVETIDFPIEEEVDVGLSMRPTKTATTTAITPTKSTEASAPPGGGDSMDMEESSDEDEEDTNIRVVPSYTPKVVGTYDPSQARAVDPITGKSVSVADMPEHMRIQLLDPKWAEERKKFQDKQKDSNLVGGDAVVANIARMSQAPGASSASTTQTASGGIPSGGASRPSAPAVTTAPMVGPAVGRGDARRSGPQAPSQQQHGAFRGPPSGAAEESQPPLKRQRMDVEIQQQQQQQQQQQPQHKVTVAPPLVPNPQAANNSLSPAFPAENPSAPTAADDSAAASEEKNTEEKKTEEKKLLPADEFIATLGDNLVELQIRIPNDAANQNWNFFGQTLTLTGIDPKSIVKEVKGILSKQHLNNMPPNKIQLKSTDENGKFLNNNTSLATLNIGPKALLELKTKHRGGQKR